MRIPLLGYAPSIMYWGQFHAVGAKNSLSCYVLTYSTRSLRGTAPSVSVVPALGVILTNQNTR